MSDKIIAWHFVREDRRLGYDDPLIVAPGYVYSVSGPLKMCAWGMHGSERAIDALEYAPGPIVCRVVLYGDVKRGSDKIVARHREVIWRADAGRTLHRFACDEAERVLRSAKIPPGPSWDALAVKRAWVDGDATDAQLYAAWAGASVAAWAVPDAARDAARAAAWAAKGGAQHGAWAAKDAARDAASVAAWAARDAAQDAARAAQDAARAAARGALGAARDAARAVLGAAKAAQNERLHAALEDIQP